MENYGKIRQKYRSVETLCKPTFIRVRETFVRLESVSSSQIFFPRTCPFLMVFITTLVWIRLGREQLHMLSSRTSLSTVNRLINSPRIKVNNLLLLKTLNDDRYKHTYKDSRMGDCNAE